MTQNPRKSASPDHPTCPYCIESLNVELVLQGATKPKRKLSAMNCPACGEKIYLESKVIRSGLSVTGVRRTFPSTVEENDKFKTLFEYEKKVYEKNLGCLFFAGMAIAALGWAISKWVH